MPRTLLIVSLSVLLAGCVTYYQPRYGDDGVYYEDGYGHDRRVVVYDPYPADPLFYPYWSLDHFYFSHYWYPYSVLHGGWYPHYRFYPGWYYGRHHRGHGRFALGIGLHFGDPWYGHGWYSWYRPWYPKHHHDHYYRQEVRPAADARAAALQSRTERYDRERLRSLTSPRPGGSGSAAPDRPWRQRHVLQPEPRYEPRSSRPTVERDSGARIETRRSEPTRSRPVRRDPVRSEPVRSEPTRSIRRSPGRSTRSIDRGRSRSTRDEER